MPTPITHTLLSPSTAVEAPSPAGALDSEGFLKVLAAQLQNQDPMSGGDTTDQLQQMTQLGMLEKLDQLVVSQEQAAVEAAVGRATELIGRNVTYKTPAGEATGTVTSVTTADGELTLMLGDLAIKPADVTEVSASS